MDYLDEYGFSYRPEGEWHWFRTKPDPGSDGIKDYLDRRSLEEMGLGSFAIQNIEEVAYGTQQHPMPRDKYNILAHHDEWKGGYVEDFGYMHVETSSSLYGNSIFVGNSLNTCGPNGYAVRKAKFYKLIAEGRWNGGSVDDWGQVSRNTQILGSSLAIERANNASEQDLGSIANVERALGSNSTIESLKQKFQQCWNEGKGRYLISSQQLLEHFGTSRWDPTSDMEMALATRKIVHIRIIDQKYDEWGEVRNYGSDYMLVDYNSLRHVFEYLSSYSLSIGKIPENDVKYDSGEKVLTNVFKK